MSDCCNNITLEDVIENLKEYPGVMQVPVDKLFSFVNGGDTQSVNLGGVQTPVLRNLARQINDTYIRTATKSRLGVVQIGNGLSVTAAGVLSLALQAGGGLSFSGDGSLSVDLSKITIGDILLTGDVTGTGVVDGTGNINIATTLTAFPHIKATSGYVSLPGGIVLQWMRVGIDSLPAGNTAMPVTWTLAFPSTCAGAWANITTQWPGDLLVAIRGLSRTEGSLHVYADVDIVYPGTVYVLAVGY